MASNNDIATVEIHCIPDSAYAVGGVLNSKKARFDIQTKSTDESVKRSPLSLALILDRSGSMETDEKLTFAKHAIISVLKLLHDDDIVHLVAYDTDITVIFENARGATRQVLIPLVEQIVTGGSTNISDAIDAAAALFGKYGHQGHINRMFLFSDGQANAGLKTSAELTQLVSGYTKQGILTDSFGIGADFDAAIMKGIADAGGSRFFFLESTKVIEPFVSKALLSVFGVCGSQAQLIIRGKNGAVLTKIWGHDDLVAGAKLGDLHANNLRSILCEFTASGTTNPNGEEVESLTYELRYHRPNDLQGEPVVIRKSLSLKFVDDASLVTDIDPRVRTMHATQVAADMDTKIADLVKKNQLKEAIEVVNEQIALLKSVEPFDDDRGIIALLIRVAENMSNKLKADNVDTNLLCQGYQHQNYLKRQNSCSYMEDNAFY